MPRSAVTIAPDLTSDTTWRTLINAIKTGVEAMGWTQTSDTGQINFATSTKPAGANTVQGYAMWQAADSLAGTNPMILRLAFGSAGSATQFRIGVQFGTVTDGAGTFTGVVTWNEGNLDGPSTLQSTAWDCFFSGDTNRLCFALFDNFTASTSQQMLVGMERSHDNTGSDTNVGWWAFTGNGLGGNAGWNKFLPYVGSGNGANNQYMGLLPSQSTTTLVGTQVGLTPIFPFYVIALNPSTQILTYLQTDITGGTQITLSMYGASHTFYCLKYMRGANNDSRGYLALRWDA